MVPPLHLSEHVGPEIVESAVSRIVEANSSRGAVPPLWCPWPLPPGWTMTGVAWAGDDRTGVRATVVACSGPAPLGDGPADLLLVAEEPGVGLGNRFAAIMGLDPGAQLAEVMTEPSGTAWTGGDGDGPRAEPGHQAVAPHAKIRAAGHPTPLWSIGSTTDRSAYVGEAMGMWLYAITWPASAGYLLVEDVVLHDLTTWLPPELVYGAPSPYLRGKL